MTAADERVITYEYDGLHRRIEKTVANKGWGTALAGGGDGDGGQDPPVQPLPPPGDTHEHYLYSGWRLIETTDHAEDVNEDYDYAAAHVLQQFVWGTQYLDEPVVYDRNLDPATDDDCLEAGDARYTYHQDANWRVVALTAEDGAVVERVRYSAYGRPEVFSGYNATAGGETGAARAASTVGNPFLHQGLFHDGELGSYQNRFRQYDPKIGRFMQRDPLGYVDGANVYSYAGQHPIDFLDPFGLDAYVFDGKKLCRVTDDLKKCKKCWKARSGKAVRGANGTIKRDSRGMPIFPKPTEKEQRKIGEGPIPEGDWTLHTKRATNPKQKGIWSRKDWNDYEDNRWWWQTEVDKRSSGPWGERFSRLTPGYGEKETDTYGRKDFNIHGGSTDDGGDWESAGCIDLMCGDINFFDEVQRDANGSDVHVIVDYSGKSTPSDCKEPDDCDKPATPDSETQPAGGAP